MGLDVYLTSHGTVLPQVHSDLHPEHIFKKTYLCSSYDESGFDIVVGNMIGTNIYTVFDFDNLKEDEQGIVHVDFKAARKRAIHLLEKLLQADDLRVMTVAVQPIKQTTYINEAQALEVFRRERDEHAQDKFRAYGCREGEVFLDGIEVFGFVRGVDVLGQPAIHVVFKGDGLDWYIQAAEILVEFIDYALTLEDPGLRWSA